MKWIQVLRRRRRRSWGCPNVQGKQRVLGEVITHLGTQPDSVLSCNYRLEVAPCRESWRLEEKGWMWVQETMSMTFTEWVEVHWKLVVMNVAEKLAPCLSLGGAEVTPKLENFIWTDTGRTEYLHFMLYQKMVCCSAAFLINLHSHLQKKKKSE